MANLLALILFWYLAPGSTLLGFWLLLLLLNPLLILKLLVDKLNAVGYILSKLLIDLFLKGADWMIRAFLFLKLPFLH